MPSRRFWLGLALPIASFVLGASAGLAQTASATATAGYKRLTTIAVPGNPLTAVDFGFVDPLLPLYYTTDRSNAGVDVFDALHNRFWFVSPAMHQWASSLAPRAM